MSMPRIERRRSGFQRPVLGIVLAGGRGSRLGPLTEFRCKPELPFGKNRLVDFALANIVNSQSVNHTMILTQYLQQGLHKHLSSFDLTSHMWGKSVNIVPAQQQPNDDSWYGGTANAVYQNREMIKSDHADTVIILAADHIYKLDIRQMLVAHTAADAEFTVCGMIMPTHEAAGNFGVMELDTTSRIIGFEEKPAVPRPVPDKEGKCFASMGIYMARKQFLLDILEEDNADQDSGHDFGKDIIPRIIKKGAAIFGYDYNENIIPGEVRIEDGVEVPAHYWRDVGRIGPYWEAVMDLVSVVPYLNIYNEEWSIPTAWDRLPPSKFVTPNRSDARELSDVVIAGGCIIDNHRRLDRTVLSRSVMVGRGADLEGVIVFDRAVIGEGAQLHNTIVEEGVVVPNGVRVGFDLALDKQNGVITDEFHDAAQSYGPIRIITKSSFA